MKKRFGVLSGAAVCGVMATLALPVPAQAVTPLQTLTAQIVATGVPGAWGYDSSGVRAHSGVASVATQQSTNSWMTGRIGSVTKEFVGAVVLQLVAENAIGLDDTLESHLSGLLPYGNAVTVRQLLGQNSGIPDYLESGDSPLYYQVLLSRFATIGGQSNPAYNPSFAYTSWTPQQLVELVASEPRHNIPAGQAEYCSTNYIILGMLAQQVTGQTIEQLVRTRVIQPLGLRYTSFPVGAAMPGPYAHGYSYAVDAEGTPVTTDRADFTNYNPSFMWTAGGMVSNPQDLATFQRALRLNQIPGHVLPGWLTAQLHTNNAITLPEGLFPAGFYAGLGFWTWNVGETLTDMGFPNTCQVQVDGHEGEALGYNAWSFADSTGRARTLQTNQMVPDWDSQYGATMVGYAQLLCS